MAKSCVIDLETLGVEPSTTILAIGAVVFDTHNQNSPSEIAENGFYQTIEMEGQGRSISMSTLKWWMTQKSSVFKELFKDVQKLKFALNDFCTFYNAHNPKTVWGNGPSFDCAIMKDALGDRCPWQFWEERCVRTVKDLAFPKKADVPVFDIGLDKHNAFADAIMEAMLIQACYEDD